MRLLLLPLLVLLPLTTAAADLAAGLNQCATLSDGGQRLACFDQLAASVAPAATIAPAPTPAAVVAAPVAAAAVVATASSADQSPAAQSATAATAAIAAVAPEPVVAAATASAPAAPAPSASERFGLELQQAPADQLEQIQASVVKRKKDLYGKWVITLDNGQVWKQSESASFRFPSEQVTIERGVLGAFYLRVDGQSKSIKVKRQQ